MLAPHSTFCGKMAVMPTWGMPLITGYHHQGRDTVSTGITSLPYTATLHSFLVALKSCCQICGKVEKNIQCLVSNCIDESLHIPLMPPPKSSRNVGRSRLVLTFLILD